MLHSEVQELEPNKIALTIEIGKEKVQSVFASYFQRAATVVTVPGFRKGKVPRNVLAGVIGKDNVNAEVMEELIKGTCHKVLEEKKLVPAGDIKIEEDGLKENESFKYKVIFELMPVIPEMNYKGRALRVKQAIISDESVENVINNLAKQFAKTIPLDADAQLAMGDYILCDIEITHENVKDEELSETNAYRQLQPNADFLKPLIGLKVGETKVLSRELNSDSDKGSKYFGKKLDYSFKINRINRSKIPEINDEFAREIGEHKDLADLKNKIKISLEEKSKVDAEKRAVAQILKDISGEVTFPVPESLVDETIDSYLREVDYKWRQYGASLDDYLKKGNIDVKTYRASFHDKAVYDTKVQLMIARILELEKMSVSDSEFMQAVEEHARDVGSPVHKVLDEISKSKSENVIRSRILNHKVDEFLLNNNQINYDMVSEAELKEGEPRRDTSTDSN
ncbi:MAG: trigger factor [Candidatus Riflebacteria bacterium]|nr:trigger factor [Candidatus Riflebacteria bacterium]